MRKGDKGVSDKRNSFFSGVIVLTAANLITKIIGLIFKIPLTNMLGNEGMGYFNTAYQIYTWLDMLSTAGVPVALSMLISESHAKGRIAEEKKLFRLTVSVFAGIGLLGSALMLFFSKGLASFISADKAFLCILAISPALFFVCITSTVRGYFQGRRNMVPTAVSEIIESTLKLTVGILLGLYALNKGYELYKVAAYAILGVTVGVAASAIFLALSTFLSKSLKSDTDQPSLECESSGKLLSTFFKIAIPVMLSSSLLSMSSMFDTLIVIRRLQDIGIAETAAVALYGNYTAYCVTLFNLPPVLIYPIVSTLIPSLVAARTLGDTKKARLLTEKSLKLSAMIALPCSLGLAAMSLPILQLIFTSKANAEMAAPLLTTLAPSVFLIGVMAVTNGMLQAFKLQRYSVISMTVGAIVKGVFAYLLPAVKVGGSYLGIYASPISTFLFYFTITALNFYFLARYADVRISVTKVYIRPLISAAICAFTAVGVYRLLTVIAGEIKLLTLVAIGTAAIVYALVLLVLGAVTKSDVALIPKGEKLISKIPLIRKLVKEDK
jgi:stage V sporulation protein B